MHSRPSPFSDVLAAIVTVLCAAAIVFWAAGCIGAGSGSQSGPSSSPGKIISNGSAYIMDSWVWLGIGITVAGVFLMVFMKEGRLPLALIAAGGAALGIVFALKAVLPWIPWLIGGAIALGLLWLWAKYHGKIMNGLWGVKGLGV